MLLPSGEPFLVEVRNENIFRLFFQIYLDFRRASQDKFRRLDAVPFSRGLQMKEEAMNSFKSIPLPSDGQCC